MTHPFPDYPPTVNNQDCWNLAKKTAETIFGASNVLTKDPILGGEDVAFYQQRVPGCFAFLGSSHSADKTRYNVHHPRFMVDEDALPLGTAWHVTMAMSALTELRR
jgi:amidohydrolase